MPANSHKIKEGITRRTYCLLLGTLTFLYPLYRFIGFNVPRQPRIITISKAVPATGFITTSEFVLFDRNEKCWALSRKCTHLGCKLTYHEDRDILECPCHQSQFHAESGKVIHGPAKKPLPFYEVEKRDQDPFYTVTI